MLAYVTVASVIFTSSALLLSWVRINLLNVEEFYSYDIQMWPPKKTYSWSAHTSFEKSKLKQWMHRYLGVFVCY